MKQSPVKELILIRHAKSSWAEPKLSDRERPLNKRGKRDAPFMGERLAGHQCLPDRVVASPARRARKTARIICKRLSFPSKEIILEERLYTADIMDLYRVVRSCDDQVSRLFLVGHNYVITDMAEDLSGAAIDNIPTCGMVGLRFPALSWPQVGPGTGELLFFDYPKKHGR
ncbi:MAG: histidine phosphatase family protein [Thermodesulfobacteriota bacterium]